MSDKRRYDEYSQRKELQNAGWNIGQKDTIAVHAAEETSRHFSCKAKVGWYLNYNGYRIDSEIQKNENGPIADIVAYGKETPFIVECETGLTESIRERKMQQFYRNEPFSEVFLLEVNAMPEEHMAALAWISEHLPGEL